MIVAAWMLLVAAAIGCRLGRRPASSPNYRTPIKGVPDIGSLW